MAIVKPDQPHIQLGHPLARGLILAHTYHEKYDVFSGGGSRHPTEQSTYRITEALTGAGAAAPKGGPSGENLQFPTGALYTLSTTDSKRFEGLTKFTAIMSVKPTATTTGAFFEKNANNGVMLQRYSDNITYFRLNGVGNSCNTAANDVPLNVYTQVVAHYDGTTQSILVNNVVKASGGTAGISIPADGVAFSIGGVSGQSIEAYYDYFYFYNRPLTRSEIAWINVDPFVMFRPSRTNNIILASAAAAPSSFVFRKTLSRLGTRAGSRQVHIG